MMFRM